MPEINTWLTIPILMGVALLRDPGKNLFVNMQKKRLAGDPVHDHKHVLAMYDLYLTNASAIRQVRF